MPVILSKICYTDENYKILGDKMAVIAETKNEKLILTLDNGDQEKIDQVISKWRFKDYQSFLRFTVSTMLLNENNFLSITLDGAQQDIKPPAHSLKDEK